jgi:hypothetical protein
MALGALLMAVTPIAAAGVVGTGTAASCDEAAFDAAFAGGGTVTFNCGPDPVTITFTTTKTLTADTTIDGGGLITLSGADTVRHFLTAGNDLILDGLVLRDGAVPIVPRGAVVLAAGGGTVVIVDSTVTDNTSATLGGAVAFVPGAITSTNAPYRLIAAGSTFVGNSASAQGGVFYLQASSAIAGVGCTEPPIEAEVLIINSTFTGNNAGETGDILSIDAFSEDPECPDSAQALIAYSTFAGNTGDFLFTLVTGTQDVEIELAANVIGPNTGGCLDGSGAFTSLGYNVTDDATCFAAPTTGDQVVADTMLGPLADNGGLTQTMALLPGSAALDAIPNGSVECGTIPDDQRDVARPQGTHCDAGAYEQEVLTDTAMPEPQPAAAPASGLAVLGLGLLLAAAIGARVRSRSPRG